MQRNGLGQCDNFSAYTAQTLTIPDLKPISEEKLWGRFVCLLENLVIFLRCSSIVTGCHGIGTCTANIKDY